VEIGGAAVAVLPFSAFEGATKKNRPNIKVYLIVFLTAGWGCCILSCRISKQRHGSRTQLYVNKKQSRRLWRIKWRFSHSMLNLFVLQVTIVDNNRLDCWMTIVLY
jgi:hypothetical protein